MLAQWDGRRRYANLRKLMRLARSYEELRGPDIEGFVRFIRDQEALGASQLEAVSEEEGADAVRLLTIHAAKGLEFKVVIVADAGRDTGGAPSSDEILVRPDGRFGFRVIDPGSGRKRGVFSYEEVRDAEKRDDEAERLRLYYVAMTRAIDRLIVSGAFDAERTRDRGTPIGWVLDRLGLAEDVRPGELERGAARFLVSLDRHTHNEAPVPEPVLENGQLALFAELPSAPTARGYRLPELASRFRCRRSIACAVSRTRRSPSSSGARTATTPSASRVFASSGPRARAEAAGCSRPRSATRCTGCSSSSISARLTPPTSRSCATWYPAVTDDEVARIATFVGRTASPSSRARVAQTRRRRARSGRSRSSTTASCSTAGSTSCGATGRGRSSLDYKTNSLAEGTPEEIVEADYRLQRLVYALACFRAGADEVEVVYHFLERPDAVVSRTFDRLELPVLEQELSEAIARIDAGEFVADPGRLHVLGLPGARRRVRGAEAPAACDPAGECRVATSPRRAAARWRRRRSASARSSSGSPSSTPTRRSRSTSTARSSCSSR